MLKAFLGKYDTSTSTFVVPGLPPLEINAGRNGYFDGYIMSATGMDHMWLTPSYDNIAAIAAAAVVVPPRAGFSIQRGSLAIVRLQYKGNVKRWTRVIVENRQDAAHVQVYLIDYGARQTLSARSLYEMPLEMKRFPPQAFPILPQITSPPDYGPGEWARLEKAAPLTESGSQERRRIEADTQTACKPPLPDELKQQHSIVPLQPTAIAIIAALMGSSSAILDKRLSRTIAIETGKENSIVDGSFDTRPRFGAGTSDISSIKGSSPRPGGVMITPVTSSERSNVSRSQSYQPSSEHVSRSQSYQHSSGHASRSQSYQTSGDHVSKSQSSQRPEGEMITPVTTSERSSVSRSQSYLPSSDQSATSPSSSENSSSERSSDQGALGVAERSNSNPPTSVDNEYFESVTPDDVQRILMERAIIRQQLKRVRQQRPTPTTSSLSSFVSAVSYQETTV
ncbi:hypothetical protein Q1695_003511 [Nippostrongylus brasiliensis]|nr:hypothetical protein Q1695_003511 [Nippostrongylus brasiliensis]